MGKAKFERNKPHDRSLDHGKTTLTAAITEYFGDFKAFDQIVAAPEEKALGIEISTAPMEYDGSAALCPRRLPGPRRLCKELDDWCGIDGQRDSGLCGIRRPGATDAWTTDVNGTVILPKGTEMVMPGDNLKFLA